MFKCHLSWIQNAHSFNCLQSRKIFTKNFDRIQSPTFELSCSSSSLRGKWNVPIVLFRMIKMCPSVSNVSPLRVFKYSQANSWIVSSRKECGRKPYVNSSLNVFRFILIWFAWNALMNVWIAFKWPDNRPLIIT